ncbi:hypothetical protein C8R43DRAFT_444597 [Mycena crocata]|nr:hypothetical protein C8R43DRAFT_444597 [Mycena crocata]
MVDLRAVFFPFPIRLTRMVPPSGPLSPAPRDQASEDVSTDSSLQVRVIAFDIISAIGLLLLTAVFFTALLSPSVKRVSTWYTYILAWMAFCVTPFLVVGHQTQLDPPPSFVLCAIDSALMYASRPFAAFATLSLIIHLYLNVSSRLKHGEVRPEWIFALIIVPPILFLIIFLWTLILGVVRPDQVELEPGGFYCHLSDSLPANVGAALVACGTSLALVVEVFTAILLSRNWRAFRALQRRDEHVVSLSIIIRISVFGILPIIGLVLSFTTYIPNLVDRIFPVYNILLALLPTSAAIIFGSQMDLMRVWVFWRVAETSRKIELSPTTSTSSGSHILRQIK